MDIPGRWQLAGLLALGCLVSCQSKVMESPPPGAPSGWPAYGATPGGTHFSRADQITPANVGQLEIASAAQMAKAIPQFVIQIQAVEEKLKKDQPAG